MKILSAITIAALCGCLGLFAWVMFLRSGNDVLRDDLKDAQIALAVCKADVLNQIQHEERENEVNATPDADLGVLIRDEWMRNAGD
ncbi:hypothetical protein [Pacificibacter marinus]|uniref:hypothetical protein n=1 Tax=Pacificibacter marinus TaxID=658057 RepID=UPI001C079DE9|nr:hypothetical protein [Pacificibacter marinus]MBU2867007.1 hypothetical protein [Pacificibacter marinus]